MENSTQQSSLPSVVAQQIAVALCYALLAKLVLTFYSTNGMVTVLWPSSGLALAALLLGGNRFWIAIFIGAFGSAIWFASHIPLEAAAIASGATLEVLLAARLLRQFAFDNSVARFRDFYLLLAISFVAPVLCAPIAATALLYDGDILPTDYLLTVLHWWMGDTLGLLLLTPLILVWRTLPRGWQQSGRLLELTLVLLLSLLAGLAVFLDAFQAVFGGISQDYWLFLFVALGSVRFGRHGVLLVIWMILLLALAGVASGEGFFGDDMARTGLVNLWCYITILTVIGLALATIFRELQLSDYHLRASERRFRTVVNALDEGVMLCDADGQVIMANPAAEKMLEMSQQEIIANRNWQPLCEDETPFPPEKLPVSLALSHGQHTTGVVLGDRRRDGSICWKSVNAVPIVDQRQARVTSVVVSFSDISEIRRVTSALIESEATYRLLAENATDCIFWLDVEGHYKYIAPACEAISGHNAAEFLDNPELMVQIIHPDDRASYQNHLADAHHPDTGELEYRIINKDGPIRWLAHHCHPMFNERGEFLGRRGTNRDITIRKQAEARRDLLGEALHQTMQPLLLADTQWQITYLNPAFSQLFGYELTEMMGESLLLIVPPDAVARAEQRTITLALMNGGTWSGEQVLRAKSGALIPCAINVGTIHDDRGDLTGFVGSYLDLRPLHEKEMELRKLSMAVEQSPEGIVVTDLQASIEYVNEAFVRRSGYSREELIGQNPRMMKSGKTPDETYRTLWKNLKSGQPWQGEFYNRRKDGSEFVEHAIISPIRQPDGRISHYIAVKEDITERKRAEAEIHRLAYFDTLTTLPNRTLLLERMGQMLLSALKTGHFSALLLLNIDRFRTINDAGGQTFGDALLRAIGERLVADLSDANMVARVVGDEFAILLADYASQQQAAANLALHVAERLLATLAEPFLIGDEQIVLTASIGIATFPESDEESALNTLRRANTALHHAKSRGIGEISFFNERLDELAKQHLSSNTSCTTPWPATSCASFCNHRWMAAAGWLGPKRWYAGNTPNVA